MNFLPLIQSYTENLGGKMGIEEEVKNIRKNIGYTINNMSRISDNCLFEGDKQLALNFFEGVFALLKSYTIDKMLNEDRPQVDMDQLIQGFNDLSNNKSEIKQAAEKIWESLLDIRTDVMNLREKQEGVKIEEPEGRKFTAGGETSETQARMDTIQSSVSALDRIFRELLDSPSTRPSM